MKSVLVKAKKQSHRPINQAMVPPPYQSGYGATAQSIWLWCLCPINQAMVPLPYQSGYGASINSDLYLVLLDTTLVEPLQLICLKHLGVSVAITNNNNKKYLKITTSVGSHNDNSVSDLCLYLKLWDLPAATTKLTKLPDHNTS